MRPRDIIWNWLAQNWAWLFTFVLAAYGAVLSTYREVQARRDKHPKVRVQLHLEMLVLDGPTTTNYVQVSIAHEGGPSMFFQDNCASIAVEGVTGSRLLIFNDKLTDVRSWPHELRPGSSFYIMARRAPLNAALGAMTGKKDIQLAAFVSDAIGREFKSKWASCSIDP